MSATVQLLTLPDDTAGTGRGVGVVSGTSRAGLSEWIRELYAAEPNGLALLRVLHNLGRLQQATGRALRGRCSAPLRKILGGLNLFLSYVEGDLNSDGMPAAVSLLYMEQTRGLP